MPGRRGPATLLDIDDTGVTVESHWRAPRVARLCVRKRMDSNDLGDLDWHPVPGRLDELPVRPPSVSGKCVGGHATNGLGADVGEGWDVVLWKPR